MGGKEIGRYIGQFRTDARELGVRRALREVGDEFYLRRNCPEVAILDREGNVLEEGLLLMFNKQGTLYMMRFYEEKGPWSPWFPYPPINEQRIVTKDGREMTPEVFKELVGIKAEAIERVVVRVRKSY